MELLNVANIVLLTGTFAEITEVQRDSSGKEWINFKLKVLQDGAKETIVPCSASGNLALNIYNDYYQGDSVEITGKVSSVEKTSKNGNIYYELKIYAQKVSKLNSFVKDEKEYVGRDENVVQPEKQPYSMNFDILDDDLPF